ncbi:MAG: hypothetical protein C4318_07265 [Acidimicrobiia bacterium]
MTLRSEKPKRKRRKKAEEAHPEASEPRLRRKGSLAIAGIALGIATTAVSFSFYRYFWVDSPARALERWAEATREGDCDASYEGLSASVKDSSVLGEKDNWCQVIGSRNFIGTLSVEKTLREGTKACVVSEIHNPDSSVKRKAFILVYEERSWKVDLGADPVSVGIRGCPEA